MSKNNLIKKAKYNYIVAKWAEDNEYYDVSVSRYYYTLYEKAIYIAKQKRFYNYSSDNKNSHIIFINHFHENIEHLLNESEVAFLNEFGKLRRLRTRSDYYEQIISSKNDFNLEFKFYFNEINNIMDKLIV